MKPSLTLALLLLLPLTGSAQSFLDLLSRGLQQAQRSATQNGSQEVVVAVSSDGLTFTSFTGSRYGGPLNLYVPRGTRPSDFLYFFPPSVSAERLNANQDVLKIPPGGYSSMDTFAYAPAGEPPYFLSNADGTYTYRSHDPSDAANAQYGFWSSGGFDHFALSWILPSNVEVLEYSSNRDSSGRWRYKPPILSFVGSRLNNFSYEVRFRVRKSETLEMETMP